VRGEEYASERAREQEQLYVCAWDLFVCMSVIKLSENDNTKVPRRTLHILERAPYELKGALYFKTEGRPRLFAN